MSVLNLIGAMLFFVAYVVEYNYWADGEDALEAWLIATPFAIGSIFFLFGSYMSVWMWKGQNFGLGFAKTLVGNSRHKVDLAQMFMIFTIIIIIIILMKIFEDSSC